MSYVSYVLESVARRADTLTIQDWQCFLMSSFIFCIQSTCFVLPCSAPKIFFAMGFIASTRLDLSLLSNRKPQVFLLPSGDLGRGFTWRSLRRNPRDARCERNPGAPWWTPKNAHGETSGGRCFSVFVFFFGKKNMGEANLGAVFSGLLKSYRWTHRNIVVISLGIGRSLDRCLRLDMVGADLCFCLRLYHGIIIS